MQRFRQKVIYLLGLLMSLYLVSCATNSTINSSNTNNSSETSTPSPSGDSTNNQSTDVHETTAAEPSATPSEQSSPTDLSTSPSPAELSEAQKTSLRELGIPVAIPAYIPDGFQVSQVIANTCSNNSSPTGSCREGPNYTIVYRNPQNTCIVVSAVGGGVGGGESEFEFRTQTTLLGEVILLFGKPSGENQAPTSAQLRVPQPNLSSFPATLQSGKPPYYDVVVGDADYYRETYGCGKNASLTPLDLEKIVQSLALLGS